MLFEGWLLNGAFNSDDAIGLQPGESLQAFFPEPQFIPRVQASSPGENLQVTVVQCCDGRRLADRRRIRLVKIE